VALDRPTSVNDEVPLDRTSSLSSIGSGSDHSVLVSVVGRHQLTPAISTVTAAGTDVFGPGGADAAPQRTWRWKLVNYFVIPAALPLLAAYWLLALLLGVVASFMVWPSLLLAQRLYWACPFIPHIWRSQGLRSKVGVVGSWLLRLQFEGAHCATVLSRLLTLPMRPHLPDFYLLGFPVSCKTLQHGRATSAPSKPIKEHTPAQALEVCHSGVQASRQWHTKCRQLFRPPVWHVQGVQRHASTVACISAPPEVPMTALIELLEVSHLQLH